MFTDNARLANFHVDSISSSKIENSNETNADIPASTRVQCPQCNRTYVSNRTLFRHLRYECGKEPQFRCPFCEHRCKLRENMRRHIVIRHKCLSKGKSF